MYVLTKSRGMGDLSKGAFSTQCGGGLDALNPDCWSGIWPFSIFVSPKPQVLAPPSVPSGSRGEVVLPPAGSSGGTTLPTDASQAGNVVQDVVNQQMAAQQQIAAGNVKSSWLDTVEGNLYALGDSVSSVNWPLWVGIGAAGVLGIALMGRRR